MTDGPISALASEPVKEPEAPKAESVASDAPSESVASTPVQTVPTDLSTNSVTGSDNPNPTPGTVDTPPTAPSTTVTNPAVTAPVETDDEKITRLLMASIAPVGTKNNFKMMIYGDPGTAKSSWLGGAGNQLIYDQEYGAYA